MGFFNRRANAAQHPDGPATQPAAVTRKQRGNKQPYNYSMATRPSFGQWIKYTWLDILTMVVMGAIGLGVSEDYVTYKRCRNS